MSAIATLLVANRGEIAVRIIRTAKAMGLRSVAIYSDADAGALHVRLADVAVRVGPAAARESYLDIEAVLDAAARTQADAIHPGYGFLSENADFAERCGQAGLIFVGPSPEAMRAMGSKAHARALMRDAGLPVVPGYEGEDQTDAALGQAAQRIGFPVLLKASAGGGGRGLRIVASPETLADALPSARREALGGFGDDRMVVERYLPSSRHVEVQVFGDHAGRVLHLLDRDCSIQRRHQKIIEEAPAPGLPDELRRNLRLAAVEAARAVSYVGAGTVEFLVAADEYYFMEMNTRLQVEHPVTESVTGLDLVEWQIRVAAGEALPFSQDELTASGHAVEVRLCAEDPASGFLPQAGRIEHLRLPRPEPFLRVDTGIREGDEISLHYDSLMAKIIASGRDRGEAIGRLTRALAATEVTGLPTNRQYLLEIVSSPAFRAGDLDTAFLDRHSFVRGDSTPLDQETLALCALVAAEETMVLERGEPDPADPFSPWADSGGWRLHGTGTVALDLAFESGIQSISMSGGGERRTIEIGGTLFRLAHVRMGKNDVQAALDGRAVKARFVRSGSRITMFIDGREHGFELVDRRQIPPAAQAASGSLVSPMPGTVIAVEAKVGDIVEQGATLAVVEAMKMEHAVRAPRRGIVAAVPVAAGDRVAAGDTIAVLTEVP